MSAGSVSTKPRLSAEILFGTAKHRLLREARTNRNKKLGVRVKVGKNGTSRVVHWLGLRAFHGGAAVQSLVRELRSHILQGAKNKT